jgi:dihydroflavonol-4-reductase
MTLTTILPSAVLGPVFTAETSAPRKVIQAMMNGSMPAYPRVGFHVASRACPCLAARPRGAW